MGKESSMEKMLPQLLLLHTKYPFNKVEVTSAEELSSQPPMLCLPVTAKSTDSLADTLLLWEVPITDTWTNNFPPGVVEPATLPASGQEFTGNAIISGWGK